MIGCDALALLVGGRRALIGMLETGGWAPFGGRGVTPAQNR